MAHIQIDASSALVVLVCASCNNAWNACTWSVQEAHDSAVRHEKRTHPGEDHAAHARREWRRRERARHAGQASPVR